MTSSCSNIDIKCDIGHGDDDSMSSSHRPVLINSPSVQRHHQQQQNHGRQQLSSTTTNRTTTSTMPFVSDHFDSMKEVLVENALQQHHDDIGSIFTTDPDHHHSNQKRHGKNDTNHTYTNRTTRPLSMVSTLLQNCLCDTSVFYHPNATKSKVHEDDTDYNTNQWRKVETTKRKDDPIRNMNKNHPYYREDPNNSMMIVQLRTGMKLIGLGAMIEELTPQQRVYDTLEVLSLRHSTNHHHYSVINHHPFLTDASRIVSIGHLVRIESPSLQQHQSESSEKIETIVQRTNKEKNDLHKTSSETVIVNYIPYDLWTDELVEYMNLHHCHHSNDKDGIEGMPPKFQDDTDTSEVHETYDTKDSMSVTSSGAMFLTKSIQRILSLLIAVSTLTKLGCRQYDA
jgi:hypothetical protein